MIKIIHILTEPDTEREKKSVKSLNILDIFGNIQYIQQINERYKGDVPSCTDGKIYGKGHYGAYLSFKKAIKNNFTDNIDALMLCECDCVLNISPIEFHSLISKSIKYCEKEDICQLSFGGNNWWVDDTLNAGNIINEENDNFLIVDQIIKIHCIILTKKYRNFILSNLEKTPWKPADEWLNLMFKSKNQAVTRKEIAYQYEGVSLIEGTVNVNSTKSLPWYTQFDFSKLKNNIICKYSNNNFYIKIKNGNKESLKIEFIYKDRILYREHNLFDDEEFISKTNEKINNIDDIKIKFYLSESDFYLFYKKISE